MRVAPAGLRGTMRTHRAVWWISRTDQDRAPPIHNSARFVTERVAISLHVDKPEQRLRIARVLGSRAGVLGKGSQP